MNMRLLKLLIFTLTFCGLVLSNDECQKGQRVSHDGRGCIECSDGTFQPEKMWSKWCRACTVCDEASGSKVSEICTKEKNTICTCRGEFVPLDSDFSTCECGIGYGKENGECSKCGDGYFSTSINSQCRKWKECKTGVKRPGNATSDVICNNESEDNTYVTTPPSPSKTVSLTTFLKSHHPHEGAQTQRKHTSTTTTSAAGRPVTPKNKEQPLYPSNTGNQIGMAILIFGIVGLLVLTAVTCKQQFCPYMERQPGAKKNESVCRRPVEESGDSLTSLKPKEEEEP